MRSRFPTFKEVSDQVANIVNAGTYTESFLATSKYLPEAHHYEITELTCEVVGAEKETVFHGRSGLDTEYTIHLGLLAPASKADSQLDPYAITSEEILARLFDSENRKFSLLGWTLSLSSVTHEPQMDYEEILESQRYLSVLVAKYRIIG